MPPLANVRHEAFCQGVANKLLSATEAYKQAGYEEAGADGNAARLIGNDSIKNRIKELRAESYELSKMSKEEALALLAEIVRTPAGEVKGTDKICQSVKRTKGQGWSSVEVKVPGKIEAINTIAKLCGWFQPQALDVKIESQAELASVIAKLRGAVPARNGLGAG